MNQPTSIPVIPPQPSQATYGFAALNLFQSFTRSSYQGKFGVQAPPYDPKYPLKAWLDTSVTTGPCTYNVISGSNPALMTTFKIDAVQAAAINLSGDYLYPAYAPSPDTTAVSTFGEVSQSFNAAVLCGYADAVTLSNAINGPNAPAPVEDPQAADVTWNGETRRMWDVTVAGTSLVAAGLLAIMWQKGVGAPGSWDLSLPMSPKWVPAPEPDWSSLPVAPTPVRALLPNETVQAGLLGMGVEIARTDLIASSGPSTAGSGGLTGQQAAQLETIFNWVLKQP